MSLERLRKLVHRMDGYRYRRASRAFDWMLERVSRVRLAAHVAYLALTGDKTFFAHWEARHIHGAERFRREMNDARELARYRAALTGESGSVREAVTQLGALRVRVKEQAHNIRQMQEIAEYRNKQLASLHVVWCSGGCAGGVGCRDDLTREKVLEAVRNTHRLVSWWNNNAFRKYGMENYEPHRVAWEKERPEE